MSLDYGFVKAKVTSVAKLKGSPHGSEVQYHIHLTLALPAATGTSRSTSAPTTRTTC